MHELRELYQQVILDHNHSPRNFGKPEKFSHTAEGDNPLCGDHIDIYLLVEGNVIKDIRFDGKGCAISKASASLMTSELKGKSIDEAQALFSRFHDLVTGEVSADPESIGKLEVLSGVKDFPMRVKCASLAWHTMREALAGEENKVSTE